MKAFYSILQEAGVHWLVLFFLFPAWVLASPLLPDASMRTVSLTPLVAVLADKTGAMRFAQVAAMPNDVFQPLSSMGEEINFAYQHAAYGLRFALRNLGWLPGNFLTLHPMQLGSALEMLLLSFALADRINTLRREKEAAQTEALLANEARLAVLRDSECQLERRVTERTRLLEQANLEWAAHRNALQHLAHHAPLTGLTNRVLLDLRLGHALRASRRTGNGLAVLLIDLDEFKPINDVHGHTVGDEVLREVAEHFQGLIRESDTVARLGGDEFVVVLEGLRSEREAGQGPMPACIASSRIIAAGPTMNRRSPPRALLPAC